MDGDGASLDPAPDSLAGARSARVRRSAAAIFDRILTIGHVKWRFYHLMP